MASLLRVRVCGIHYSYEARRLGPTLVWGARVSVALFSMVFFLVTFSFSERSDGLSSRTRETSQRRAFENPPQAHRTPSLRGVVSRARKTRVFPARGGPTGLAAPP